MKKYRVLLVGSWCTSRELVQVWSKMVDPGLPIELVDNADDGYDYVLVINCPYALTQRFPWTKTMLVQMEPNMQYNAYWPELWRNPPAEIHTFATHQTELNFVEWHLNVSYTQLIDENWPQTEKQPVLSMVVSSKYSDPGHKFRIDLMQYIQEQGRIDTVIFGHPAPHGKNAWKNYAGKLPLYDKNLGLAPYMYTLNAENHAIDNYITEKVWDAILSETLLFYWGSPNIKTYVGDAVICLPKEEGIEHCARIIEMAIQNGEYYNRLGAIKAAKHRLLKEWSISPRILAWIDQKSIQEPELD